MSRSIDPATAALCEGTDVAVAEFEERSGLTGCPLCGRPASEHPPEEPEE